MISLVPVYIKQRQGKILHLSLLIAMATSILFFLTVFIGTVERNLRFFWVDSFIGGDIWVNRDVQRVDWVNNLSGSLWIEPESLDALTLSSKGVLPQLKLACLAQNMQGTEKKPLVLIGLNKPEDDSYVFMQNLSEGQRFTSGKGEVILTSGLAYSLNVKVGEDIVFFGQTRDGYPNVTKLRLSGLFEWPSAGPIAVGGEYFAFTTAEEAQSLADVSLDTWSEIVTVPGQIEPDVENSLTQTLRRFDPLLTTSISRMMKYIFTFLRIILFALVGLIIAFIIFNNVRLLMLQSQAEIGLFLSFGATHAQIAIVFLLPVCGVVGASIVIGLSIGLALISFFNGLGFYAINTVTEILLSTDHLVIAPNVADVALSLGFIGLIGLIAAIMPFAQTLRIRPLVALWRER